MPNNLKNPKLIAWFKKIEKQLADFSDEHQAFYMFLVLIPTDVEEIDGYRCICEEEGLLAGRGPKEHLLETLTAGLKDIDDGHEFIKDFDKYKRNLGFRKIIKFQGSDH